MRMYTTSVHEPIVCTLWEHEGDEAVLHIAKYTRNTDRLIIDRLVPIDITLGIVYWAPRGRPWGVIYYFLLLSCYGNSP